VRIKQGGPKPECPNCKSSEHVVRLWHGPVKVWICAECYRPKSTELTTQTLMERLMHKPPKEKDFDLREILPNRAARRRRMKR